MSDITLLNVMLPIADYVQLCFLKMTVKELGIVRDSILFKMFKIGLVLFFFFFKAIYVIFWSYADVVHCSNMVKS